MFCLLYITMTAESRLLFKRTGVKTAKVMILQKGQRGIGVEPFDATAAYAVSRSFSVSFKCRNLIEALVLTLLCSPPPWGSKNWGVQNQSLQ